MDTEEQVYIGVDIEIAPPCEHSQHTLLHEMDDPAAYLVEHHHAECGDKKRYLICTSGLIRLYQGGVARCGSGPCDDVVQVVQVLKIIHKL